MTAPLNPARFCFKCGQALVDSALPRANEQCLVCGYKDNAHPKILVSCLASWQDKVLWMRRAQEPYRGLWSVPCGFMEQGETLAAAAVRELEEETGVRLTPDSLTLYVMGSLTWMNQVYVVFRARMDSDQFQGGVEALDVGLFNEREAPWSNFAFPQSEAPTRQFYKELATGKFGVYMGEYTPAYLKTWIIGV